MYKVQHARRYNLHVIGFSNEPVSRIDKANIGNNAIANQQGSQNIHGESLNGKIRADLKVPHGLLLHII